MIHIWHLSKKSECSICMSMIKAMQPVRSKITQFGSKKGTDALLGSIGCNSILKRGHFVQNKLKKIVFLYKQLKTLGQIGPSSRLVNCF